MFAAVIQSSCTSDWFPSRRNGAAPSPGSSGSRIGRPHVSRFAGTCHTFPGSGTGAAPTVNWNGLACASASSMSLSHPSAPLSNTYVVPSDAEFPNSASK